LYGAQSGATLTSQAQPFAMPPSGGSVVQPVGALTNTDGMFAAFSASGGGGGGGGAASPINLLGDLMMPMGNSSAPAKPTQQIGDLFGGSLI
jgi:hypothetical protein